MESKNTKAWKQARGYSSSLSSPNVFAETGGSAVVQPGNLKVDARQPPEPLPPTRTAREGQKEKERHILLFRGMELPAFKDTDGGSVLVGWSHARDSLDESRNRLYLYTIRAAESIVPIILSDTQVYAQDRTERFADYRGWLVVRPRGPLTAASRILYIVFGRVTGHSSINTYSAGIARRYLGESAKKFPSPQARTK